MANNRFERFLDYCVSNDKVLPTEEERNWRDSYDFAGLGDDVKTVYDVYAEAMDRGY